MEIVWPSFSLTTYYHVIVVYYQTYITKIVLLGVLAWNFHKSIVILGNSTLEFAKCYA